MLRPPAATRTRTRADKRGGCGPGALTPVPPGGGAPYAELQVTTNYSFLRSASHVEELLASAKALGLAALGITDHNTLASVARAHACAAEAGVRLVVGCRLDLRDGLPVLAYPLDRAGYAGLCRLLTLGKGRAGKGGCDLAWADLVRHGDGLLLVLLPDQPDAGLGAALARLRDGFPGRGYLSLSLRRRPGDAARLHLLAEMAGAPRVPTVVTGDVPITRITPEQVKASGWSDAHASLMAIISLSINPTAHVRFSRLG